MIDGMNDGHQETYFTRMPKRFIAIGVILLVLGAIAGFNLFSKTPPPILNTLVQTPQVQVTSVGNLSSAIDPLSVTGTVTSLTQATILAQTSGQITSLPYSLGSTVRVGSIIATFENASQKAIVLQTEGVYDSARAMRNRVVGNNSKNTTETLITTLTSAYAAIDDAVHTRSDALFTNPKTNPQLVIIVPDNTLVIKVKAERLALEESIAKARGLANSATVDTVTARSVQMAVYVKQVVTFLDNLIQAVNETPFSQSTPATTLASYQASLAAARSEVIAALANITNAKNAYDSNDLNSANAAVKQARGALDAAEANLGKTIVRSPVNGTIVTLPITLGDYAPMNSLIATVSNPHTLYIKTDVTSDDARTLTVGEKVMIDNTIQGNITFIAPALDPSTGKIRVKIGITGNSRTIVNGKTVSLSLARVTIPNTTMSTTITIPIIATKILPIGPAVFTVSTSSTLSVHPIKLGTILGNRVTVVSGLTPDMLIVTDARGLASGQTVIVATSTTL